jgi:hypothetical protein
MISANWYADFFGLSKKSQSIQLKIR